MSRKTYPCFEHDWRTGYLMYRLCRGCTPIGWIERADAKSWLVKWDGGSKRFELLTEAKRWTKSNLKGYGAWATGQKSR